MRSVLAGVGPVVALMIAGGSASAQAADPAQQGQQHCVQQVTVAGQPPPAARCFVTYAGAVAYLTGGRVQLASDLAAEPDGTGSSALDQQINAAEVALSVHVLSTEYVGASFSGSTYTFTWSSDCSALNIAWASMPSGWDNVISSSRPGATCDAIHYDNSGAGPNSPPSGDSYACPSACSGLGTMNDRTSSMRWVHT
jgi:hypothetical protein